MFKNILKTLKTFKKMWQQ